MPNIIGYMERFYFRYYLYILLLSFDEPLFLAKDVAEWIDFGKTSQGYYDISAMLRKIDEEEKIKKSSTILNRSTWFLTEDGLYEVLMQSRKPIAKFKGCFSH